MEKSAVQLQSLGQNFVRMTSTLKQLDHAEKDGVVSQHFQTVRKMIPFFPAGVTITMPKCSHIFIENV